MLFGAAYYPEYQSHDRLDQDIALMLEAGFTYVRLGESTWQLWEPRDGDFRFDWIERVVDRCHAAGLSTILGTPTYAVPAWLVRRYPEILAHRATRIPVRFGGRQNVDLAHAAYLFHAERVIRAAVGHFAGHPGVIGYQVDNETGVHLLHNPDVHQRFADRLRERYGSVRAVNRAWGTEHWSLGLGDWADLWPADENSSPGYQLDWRRFQTELTCSFLDWQAAIVRESAGPDQFTTHCCVGGHAAIRPAADSRRIARIVDRPAVNIYYSTQRGLSLPGPGDRDAEPVPNWSAGNGPWALYLQADFARVDERGFLVLESNGSNAGYPHENRPPYPGQLRQAGYAMAARGARGIGYWHWHSCHSGKEIYWRGVLGHDYAPGERYTEVARLGGELRALGPLLERAVPDADVALWHSKDSDYALGFLPPLAADDGSADTGSYRRIFDTFYRGCFDAGLQMSVVDEATADRELDRHRVLIVPAAYVLSDAAAQRLEQYALRGGHLVLTFRTGYADEHGRVRETTAPGPFAQAAGIRYRDFTNLRAAVPVLAETGAIDAAGCTATAWADYLEPLDADVLLRYQDPHLAGYAAATSRVHGAGRVSWIGTLPDAALARRLAEWCAARAGITPDLPDLPPQLRADSLSLPDGSKLYLLANWSDEPVSFELPFAAAPAPGAAADQPPTLPPGTTLRLEARGVLPLQRHHQAPPSTAPAKAPGRERQESVSCA